jgi:hypothetical protein
LKSEVHRKSDPLYSEERKDCKVPHTKIIFTQTFQRGRKEKVAMTEREKNAMNTNNGERRNLK